MRRYGQKPDVLEHRPLGQQYAGAEQVRLGRQQNPIPGMPQGWHVPPEQP